MTVEELIELIFLRGKSKNLMLLFVSRASSPQCGRGQPTDDTEKSFEETELPYR